MTRAPVHGVFALVLGMAAACGSAPLAPRASSIGTESETAASPPSAAAPGSAAAEPEARSSPSPVPSGDASTEDPPKRIGARHVLIQWMGSERAAPSVMRTREQAMVVATEVLKRARAGEDLARLAVEYSDEPGAAARGGSLGRFGRGQMVGAFESAAFRLKVNEVSGVIETPFGFHVIERTD